MKRLLTELRNEWRVVGLHPIVWLAVAGATLLSALVVRGSPLDPAEGAGAALRWLNLFLPMFLLPFAAGAVAPIIYLREVSHEMDGIVGSYPLSPRRWLTIRVGSFFLLLMVVCAFAQISFIVMLQHAFPDQLGSLAQRSLGWLFLIQGPTCFLWASALALLACKAANSAVVYVSAAAGLLLYLIVATLTGTPMIAGSFVAFAPLKQAMLVIDPYAATALLGAMPESGALQSRGIDVALGRLFWLGIGALLVSRVREVPSLQARFAPRARRTRRPSSGRSARPLSLHLRFVVRDKVFLLLIIGWVVMLLPEALAGMDYVEPFAVVAPDSRDSLNRVMWDMVGAIAPVLLVYFSDRICRLYATTRMAELYAATPHRAGALVLVQLASLCLVATGLVALAEFTVLAAQLATGSSVELAEYGAQSGLVMSRLWVFAGLFVAVHGLLRSRTAANVVAAVLVAMGSNSVASMLGLQHPLARPLATPLTVPDAVWGYGGSVGAHWQVLAFWLLITLAALVLATASHPRTLRFAQRRPSQILRQPATAGAAVLLALAAVQGTRIDNALRSEGALVTRGDRDDWRVQYEQRFGDWRKRAQPVTTAIRSRIDFYPTEQRVRLDSSIYLVNRTSAPIDRLLIGRNLRDPGAGTVHVERAAVETRDERLGQTIYRLARPLEAGEGLTLRFSLTLKQSGLAPAAVPLVLRDLFNALPVDELLPVIGFNPRFELRDSAVRRDHGLPPKAIVPPSRLPAPRPDALRDDMVMLDTVIGTEAGQHAIGQGEMVNAWQSANRSYARFRTPAPIHNMPVFFSVPWAAARYSVGKHELRVYGPRRIAADHPTILGAADALAWLDSAVAPYSGRTLALVATPEIGLTGFALPQVVELSDRVAFKAVPSPDAQFSQAYRRAAHETAHQWFGHQLGHGLPEERAFLVESLAKYAELVMIERRYGSKAMRALVAYERDRYRQDRSDPERSILPLIDGEDGPDLYSRATLVFACLRDKVGDDRIVQALRESIRAQASGTPTRSIDFVRRLYALAPANARGTVARLLLGTSPVEQAISRSRCDPAKPNPSSAGAR